MPPLTAIRWINCNCNSSQLIFNMKHNLLLNFHKTAVRIALLCTAVLLIACLIPSYQVPRVNVPLFDKWVHFIAFGVWSFFVAASFKNFGFKQWIIVVISTFLFGWIIELLQVSGITRGRSYENLDILADGIGGLLGASVYWLFKLRR